MVKNKIAPAAFIAGNFSVTPNIHSRTETSMPPAHTMSIILLGLTLMVILLSSTLISATG